MTRHRTILLPLLASAALTLTVPAASYGQEWRYRDREDKRSRPSYEGMQQLARELDEAARRAYVQARRDQGNRRERDTKFLSSLDEFARAATQFRRRIDASRTRPRNVDEGLEELTEEARDVQYRIVRARFVDARTRQDWDRVVSLLNRMTSQYRYGGSTANGKAPYSGYPGGDYGHDVLPLARELEERAYRAAELTRRSSPYGYGDSLGRFVDQTREFRGQLEQNRLTQQQIRSNVSYMIDAAQSAQDDLNRTSGSRDARVEWDGVMQTLRRIREVAAT